MNKTIDQYSEISPRFAGTIFFSIYTLLIIILLKFTLLKYASLLPLVLFALIAGSLTGHFFASSLAKKRRWYYPFLIGILVAIVLLLLGSLIAVIAYIIKVHVPNWRSYLVLYATSVLAFFFLVGIWFLPLTGLAGIYFNKKFFPGLVAADRKRQENQKAP